MPETNPYAPYPGLSELLEAAGVGVAEMHFWSTEKLLQTARARAAAKASKETRGVPPTPRVKTDLSIGPFTQRTIRIPIWLLEAVDKKAKKEGTSLNAVAGQALRSYVSDVKPKSDGTTQ